MVPFETKTNPNENFLHFYECSSVLHKPKSEKERHTTILTCYCWRDTSMISISSLCHVYIKDELSIRSNHWRLPSLHLSVPACWPSNRAFKVHGCRELPYLVLKLAGCGCPSYKDKKSYSSSTAKDWKTIWILFPSSATITQVQFAPLGYPYGNPGLSIVPFLPFKVPPQVWIKPGKKDKKKTSSHYQMHTVSVYDSPICGQAIMQQKVYIYFCSTTFHL